MSNPSLLWLLLTFLVGYIGGSLITASVAFRRSNRRIHIVDLDLDQYRFDVLSAHEKVVNESSPFAPLHPGVSEDNRDTDWLSIPKLRS